MNHEEAKDFKWFQNDRDTIYNHIDTIYDYFESELNEKNKEIARLRKQIARGHHIECDCSFCKMPGFIYGSDFKDDAN